MLLAAPIKDLDFVVEGDGPSLARQLAEDMGGEVKTHDRFGTSTLLLANHRVDVVTARREEYAHPAALPRVSPGMISDDLSRRDFTVNALALPLSQRRPKLLDPHKGVADIERGLIRVLHPGSFVDDPTRIFRAIRYEQRFDFQIEDQTHAYLLDAIGQGLPASLTGDRLRHELERILEEERPVLALSRALALGAMSAIHPALGDENALARLGAVADAKSAGSGSTIAGAGPLVYIAALAYSLNPAQVEAVIHRLNMPKLWAQVVRDVNALRNQEAELAGPEIRRSRLASLVKDYSLEAVFAVSVLTDSPVVVHALGQYLGELRFVAPALNGNDLMNMGVPSGPLVGQMLRKLQEAKLDGQASTEEEERRLVREILAE